MKNKYQRLSREEKKECRTMYYSTPKGKEMQLRLTRLVIIGMIGILFGIYILRNGIFSQELHWYDYCLGISLLFASVVFLVGFYCVRKKVLNQFALKIPRFKNK